MEKITYENYCCCSNGQKLVQIMTSYIIDDILKPSIFKKFVEGNPNFISGSVGWGVGSFGWPWSGSDVSSNASKF